ncbi:MAG: DUF4387 domain-containing protein [Nitrospirae bacterium]|nr:DUF4387 domain-containing protein [Magnetococcales bacterium]HAT49167.1 DUF4387 domain-containing protein [Alphaproteobacteria bacterium]
MTMVPITTAVHVIRSKNAGPYELTLDIIFKTQAGFEATRDAKIFTPQSMAKLYGIPESDILKVIHYEPARAIKITLKRIMTSGAFGETDVYGAQQHAPLLQLMVPG